MVSLFYSEKQKTLFASLVLLLSFFFLHVGSPFIFAEEPVLTIQIGDDGFGVLQILHKKADLVDEKSFELNQQPLAVSHIGGEPIDDEYQVDNYRFAVPDLTEGLHLLPAIDVAINGKRYQSTPTTYTLGSSLSSADLVDPTTVLKVVQEIKVEKPFYPGQRATFIYRILYRGQINITKEEFPLLTPKDFNKVGSLDIQDGESETHSIQTITQVVESIRPGKYTFGPAIIEGLVQQGGNSVPVHSETTEVTIEVAPFPDKNMPPSFNGAVGSFLFSAEMLTPAQLRFGDIIQLALIIESISSNASDLENLFLPDLLCQPGFSGRFQMSDLPPASKLEGNTKSFVVELRPRSPYVKAIPSIEFSFFDPSISQYRSMSSKEMGIQLDYQNEEHLFDYVATAKFEDLSKELNQVDKGFYIPFSEINNTQRSKTLVEMFLKAKTHYEASESAATAEIASTELNSALQVFHTLEKIIPLKEMPKELFANMGNLYFMLQDYPMAIVYYKKEQLINPRGEIAKDYLHQAQEKLFIPEPQLDLWQKVLNAFPKLSFVEWKWCLLILICLWVLFYSLHRWKSYGYATILTYAAGFLVAACAIQMLYLTYVSPLEGVVVRSFILFRGPGEDYDLASDKPIASGVVVDVVDTDAQGKWLKVVTPDSITGYLPYQVVRVIEAKNDTL